jgi:hypothetical protein
MYLTYLTSPAGLHTINVMISQLCLSISALFIFISWIPRWNQRYPKTGVCINGSEPTGWPWFTLNLSIIIYPYYRAKFKYIMMSGRVSLRLISPFWASSSESKQQLKRDSDVHALPSVLISLQLFNFTLFFNIVQSIVSGLSWWLYGPGDQYRSMPW